MTCRGFDELLLLEHALGKLPAEEDRRVRLHLEHCPDCGARMFELRRTAGAMNQMRARTEVDLREDSARSLRAMAFRELSKGRPAVPFPATVIQAEPADAPASRIAPLLDSPVRIPDPGVDPSGVNLPSVVPAVFTAPAVAAPVAAPAPPPPLPPPNVEPLRPGRASRSLPGSSPTGRSRRGLWWTMGGLAAAAGIATAVALWWLRPADAFRELERRVAEGISAAELRVLVTAAVREELLSEHDAYPAEAGGSAAEGAGSLQGAAPGADLPVLADLETAGWVCAVAQNRDPRGEVQERLRRVRLRRDGKSRAAGTGPTASLPMTSPARDQAAWLALPTALAKAGNSFALTSQGAAATGSAPQVPPPAGSTADAARAGSSADAAASLRLLSETRALMRNGRLDGARELLDRNRAQLEGAGLALHAALLTAWTHRGRPEPDFAGAAEVLEKAALRLPGDAARLRMLSALYRWQAGSPAEALALAEAVATAVTDAGEVPSPKPATVAPPAPGTTKDSPAPPAGGSEAAVTGGWRASVWAEVAYLYRWGLRNDLKAARALARVPNPEVRKRVAGAPVLAGLPAILAPGTTDGDADTAVFLDDAAWWPIRPSGGRLEWVFEQGRDLVRIPKPTAEPTEWLTRRRNYSHSDRDYTFQADFRIDAVSEAAAVAGDAGPYVALFGYWTQAQRSYRLVVRPDGFRFSKRRPRLPDDPDPAGQAETADDFLEYLLPADKGAAIAEPLRVGRWYTAKFRIETLPGRTRLSAKVWPRWEPEPVDWQLTAVDDGRVSHFTALPNGRVGLSAARAAVTFDDLLLAANPLRRE